MMKSPAIKWTIYLVVALIVAGAVAWQVAPDDIAKIIPYAPKPDTGNWHIHVTDMEGKPIPATRVESYSNGKYLSGFCDKNGDINVNIDRSGGRSTLKIRAAGYVSMNAQWGTGNYSLKDAPQDIEVKMVKGTEIGGKVVDDENNPIFGVKVEVNFRGENDPPKAVYPASFDTIVQTDKNGEWKINSAPAKLTQLNLSLEHPAFLAKSRGIRVPTSEFKNFMDFSDVRTMEPGIEVTGTVRGPDGTPIAGAYVTPGRSPWEGRRRQALIRKTNSSGKFTFKGCEPGNSYLTVIAKGFAPEVKQVKFEDGMNPVSFRLDQGKKVTFKVVDINKNPLPNANIGVSQFQGIQSLNNMFRQANPYKTDSKGELVWEGAPDKEPVSFYVWKQGFNTNSSTLNPKDNTIEVVLHTPMTVEGTVVDADSGSSIPNFTYERGIKWNGNSNIHWEDHTRQQGNNGSFSMKINDGNTDRQFAIRVSARGYYPAESELFKNGEKPPELVLKLKKGEGNKGVVKNAAGEPVANVELAVYTASQRMHMYNGQINNRNGGSLVRSNNEGAFTLDPITEEYGIVAVHDSGVAIASQEDFEKEKVITLEPWATVQGKAYIGTTPAANATLALSNAFPYVQNKPYFGTHSRIETDKDGNFTIEKVIPGPISVSRQVEVDTGQGGRYSQNVYTETYSVKPGEDLQIRLGGKGRPVIGKVIFPQGMKEQLDLRYPNYYINQIIPPKVSQQESNPLTNAISALFGGKRGDRRSPEEIQKSRERLKHYQFRLEEDNTFRIDDVTPGTYRMNLYFRFANEQERRGRGNHAGTINQEFTVEEFEGEVTDEPHDLGELKVLSPEELQAQQQKLQKEYEQKRLEAIQKKRAELKEKKEAKEKSESEVKKEETGESKEEKETETKSNPEAEKPEPASKEEAEIKEPEKEEAAEEQVKEESVKEVSETKKTDTSKPVEVKSSPE